MLEMILTIWEWFVALWPEMLQPIIEIMPMIVAIMIPLILSVAYLTFAERKIIGFMQVRIGPNRVGPWGLFQPFADVFKLMFKEIIIPSNSNKFLFIGAPLITFAPAMAAWAVIPFDEGVALSNIDAGLLYVLAVTSIGVYGVIIAGWASNSKYAFLGAMRSSAQIVSYEIAMGFALVGVLIAAGSLNMQDIVIAQKGSVANWFFLPLFPLFMVYFISGVAETNRAPFDVAEGESEIVAGFHVEYSGMAFAVFFLAEYANMILIAALTTVLFLGGWYSPFIGLGVVSDMLTAIPYIGWVFDSGLHWLLFKMAFFLLLFLWFRATFPRYRYDQIMRLGWKVFIPITIVWLLVTGVAVLLEIPPWFDKAGGIT